MVEIWYDVYHPDGWYMCSTSDGGRPGSVRPTNLPGGDFNPALPRWIPRMTCAKYTGDMSVCERCSRREHVVVCGASGFKHKNYPDGPFTFEDAVEQLTLF